MSNLQVITMDAAEAAMALWEECLRRMNDDDNSVFDWLGGDQGTAVARDTCLDLGKDIDRSYQVAFLKGFDDSFDWEFVPRWVEYAMEATETQLLSDDVLDRIGEDIAEEYLLYETIRNGALVHGAKLEVK